MSKKYSNQSYFESEPSDGKAGIAVQDLQKVFKSLSGSPIQAVSHSFQLGRPMKNLVLILTFFLRLIPFHLKLTKAKLQPC